MPFKVAFSGTNQKACKWLTVDEYFKKYSTNLITPNTEHRHSQGVHVQVNS